MNDFHQSASTDPRCYSDVVFRRLTVSIVVLVVLGPSLAPGQERLAPFGARATAMGGAFTAVADDASAFFWNPAGVAFGPVFQGGFQWGDSRMDRGGFESSLSGADGNGSLATDRASGFSIEMPFLGVAGTFGRSTWSSREQDSLVEPGARDLRPRRLPRALAPSRQPRGRREPALSPGNGARARRIGVLSRIL